MGRDSCEGDLKWECDFVLRLMLVLGVDVVTVLRMDDRSEADMEVRELRADGDLE